MKNVLEAKLYNRRPKPIKWRYSDPSDPVVSPDGQWTALVCEETAHARLYIDFRRLVELRRASEASGTPVLSLEGQSEGSDHVKLRWTDRRVLDVSVPIELYSAPG